jgi:hypothetical protein
MIGVKNKQNAIEKSLIACYATYSGVKTSTDMVAVHDNVCQGS